MHLSIVCPTHPSWGKVGIGWGFDHVSSQYAPPSGSRLKSKLPPWTLGMTWGFDQDCTSLFRTFYLFADPHFIFACAQHQMPHPRAIFLIKSPGKPHPIPQLGRVGHTIIDRCIINHLLTVYLIRLSRLLLIRNFEIRIRMLRQIRGRQWQSALKRHLVML